MTTQVEFLERVLKDQRQALVGIAVAGAFVLGGAIVAQQILTRKREEESKAPARSRAETAWDVEGGMGSK